MKGFKASSQSMQQSDTQDPKIIRLNSQRPSSQPQDLNILRLNTTQPQDLNILHLNAQRPNTHDPNAQRSHMQGSCGQRTNDQAQQSNAQSSNVQHQNFNTKLPSIKELGISWVASDDFHTQRPITKVSITQRFDMRREPGTSSTQNMNLQEPREASSLSRYPITQSRIAKRSDFQCPSIHELGTSLMRDTDIQKTWTASNLLSTSPKPQDRHPITQIPTARCSDMQRPSIQDLSTSLMQDTDIQKTWTTSKLSTICLNSHSQHPITKRSDMKLPSIQELGTFSMQHTQESSSLLITQTSTSSNSSNTSLAKRPNSQEP
ncbi:22532_t:CDS:2, partial [Dentiscutata erythropus]